MRILMITRYPPHRDGIAAYALQSVRALRAEGNRVEVLSPGPSAAHHHLDLAGPRGALALAKRIRHYDKVIVQFHPDFFYPLGSSAAQRTAESLTLGVALRMARSVEVVVHEIDGRHGRAGTVHGQAARWMWRAVDRLVVHTERERAEFHRNFGVPAERIAVTEHGAHFLPRTHHDRASARASLAVPAEAFVFLSIGFIQPHKGFDRAVRAFAELDLPGGRLDVVGSVRVEEPAYLAYRDELAALVNGTDNAHLHDGFVSDELFDRWIVACDVVVLPYRSIWSSGVLERARLFGRPVIATAVGGLPEQAASLAHADQRSRWPADHHKQNIEHNGHAEPPSGPIVLVDGDAELRQAMATAAGQDGEPHATRSWPMAGVDLRDRVQDEVVARAVTRRGIRLTAGRRAPGAGGHRPVAAASAALRRMRSLEPPAATAGRPLARLAKRAVRRLTAWEVDPMVHQLNTLRIATVEAIEAAVRTGSESGDTGIGGARTGRADDVTVSATGQDGRRTG